MKKIKFPTAHTILLSIAVFVAFLTWIIPAGKYDTLKYNKATNSFIITVLNNEQNRPATQHTLDSLKINIPVTKFTQGDIWKPIAIPNTYKEVDAKPQGVFNFLKAPVKGIIEAADIIFLVLFIGGLIGIINATGAFEAGISWLSNRLKGHEYILIILVTMIISAGGTTFGLAEETIAFYPILIPIFLAAKYDAMVPLASIYLGSSVGTMCSTTNPFSAIIASDSAGVAWSSGLTGRVTMLILCTSICIAYIIWYARKVNRNPEKSLLFNQKDEIEKLFSLQTHSHLKLTLRLRLILIVFSLCFIIMVYGVFNLEWWFTEMTTVFFTGALVIGILARLKESIFVEKFVSGASDLLSVALIIGIARGISVLMSDGLISDTMLYYASNLTNGMNKGVFINALLFIYAGLSFFIPSSSGMAVLTMPIISPLADTVGISREHIVDVYQYGQGLFAFINPTGLILASLAIVKVGYNKWLKFVTPLVLALLVVCMVALTISVYL